MSSSVAKAGEAPAMWRNREKRHQVNESSNVVISMMAASQ